MIISQNSKDISSASTRSVNCSTYGVSGILHSECVSSKTPSQPQPRFRHVSVCMTLTENAFCCELRIVHQVFAVNTAYITWPIHFYQASRSGQFKIYIGDEVSAMHRRNHPGDQRGERSPKL